MSGPDPAGTTRSRRIRRINLAILALLALSAIGLIGSGCESDTCAGPQLGIFAGVMALVVGIGLVVHAVADRASPLATVDALLAMPLIAVLLAALSGFLSLPVIIATALVILAIAGGIVATDEVATHRREPIALAVVLVGLILLFLPAPAFQLGIVVPAAMLVRLAIRSRRPPPKPDPWTTETTSD